MHELNQWIAGSLGDMARRAMDHGDLDAGERLYTLAKYPWHWPLAVEEVVMANGYHCPNTTHNPAFRWRCRYPRAGLPLLLHCAGECW